MTLVYCIIIAANLIFSFFDANISSSRDAQKFHLLNYQAGHSAVTFSFPFVDCQL